MNISFDGIGEVVATFAVKSSDLKTMKPGYAVTFTASGEVGFGTSASVPCGVVLSLSEDGFAAVQIGGTACVPYAGSAPACGCPSLTLDGKGAVTTATSGGLPLRVISVDSSANTAVIIL